MKKLAFCITGWHYGDRETYQKLSQIEGATLFVVSHKKAKQIPEWLYDYVKQENVLIQPNVGYDWGCYQQFLWWGKWQNFDYIFFVHDDLEIKDIGFVEPCLKLLEKYPVVGNGRTNDRVDWPAITPQAYAHSRWKPPTQDFTHRVVRGSFFVTTRESLEAIGEFDVFWDPLHLAVKLGNWSLLATCGTWESIYPDRDCFGFLSEVNCESPWIKELYRGGIEQKHLPPLKQFLFDKVRKIGQTYMKIYWQNRRTKLDSVRFTMTEILVSLFSGNRGKLKKQ